MQTLYDIPFKKTNGEETSLVPYKGKVILIVNTATKCGLAPQFEWLEQLWNTYSHDDFVIIGFPCNQFADQEPETDTSMESVCKLNFGVTFPLMAKLDVNGPTTHPLYTYLKKKKWGLFSSTIKWNFTKFLIDREGNVIKRYAPTIQPESLQKDIKTLVEKI